MNEISRRSRLSTTVRVPGSKSITHRAIIAASLTDGRSVLKDFLECEDTLYTINALREIGAQITIEGNDLKVEGRGGKFGRLYSEPSGTGIF